VFNGVEYEDGIRCDDLGYCCIQIEASMNETIIVDNMNNYFIDGLDFGYSL
jgi:hypothetical protein